MANKSNESIQETSKEAIKNKPVEVLYSVSDLAKAAKIFNATSDVVIAAMKLAGKSQATQEEASKIIKDFINKEVK